MRTDRINRLKSFLLQLKDKAQDKPDGYFTTRLDGLMWSLVSTGATFEPPIDIKAGLLQFVNEHTDILRKPSERKNKSTAGFISEPTRKKYIQMAREGKGDYNKMTFDTILQATMSAGFDSGYNFSGFWESFLENFMRFELHPMLPATEKRSGTEPFWIGKSENRRHIMVNINLFEFCAIFGKTLHTSWRTSAGRAA